jgi:hypothetical protein
MNHSETFQVIEMKHEFMALDAGNLNNIRGEKFTRRGQRARGACGAIPCPYRQRKTTFATQNGNIRKLTSMKVSFGQSAT